MDSVYFYVGFFPFWLVVGLVGWGVLSLLGRALTTASPASFYAGQHVLVTGGSTGLGRAFAMLARKAGANVTIVSCNPERLEAARATLAAAGGAGTVAAVAADVCQYEQVESAVATAVRKHGGQAPSLVVTCAGLAHPGYFESLAPAQFAAEMQLNYMGTVHALKASLPYILKEQQDAHQGRRAHLALVSSAAAIVGFAGYSAYCPSKYAVRGLADTLRNELLRHGVGVSIFFPSSIDTPGYATENLTKPAETREIEGTADLLSAEQCAALLDVGLRRGQFAITTEALIEVSRAASNGLGPRNNFPLELFVAPVLPFVQQACMMFFDSVVQKFAKQGNSTPKEKEKLK